MRLNLAKMRSQRRDALLESGQTDAEHVKAPARAGRRAAVMPMDMIQMPPSRESISGVSNMSAGSDDDDGDDNGSAGFSLLPGLTQGMLPPFLTGMTMSGSEDGSDDDNNRDDDTNGRQGNAPGDGSN